MNSRQMAHLSLCAGLLAALVAVSAAPAPAPAPAAAVDSQPQSAAAAPPAAENVARGKRYAMSPPPDYVDTMDPGDRTQLTDGEYTAGHFWTQKTTVGWVWDPKITVTVDLGADLPIRGASFNTAAGVAEVHWPLAIHLLVSVDGHVYHDLGDLTVLDRNRPAPPEGTYSLHRYVADGLQSHGRYVKLVIESDRAYVFVDEIEVQRGEDAWLPLPLPGKGVRFPLEYYDEDLLTGCVKHRLAADLEAARSLVLDTVLDEALQTRLQREAAAIEDGIAALPKVEPAGFRTTVPMNALQARAYAIRGAVRAAQGQPPLTAWGANPWDFLDMAPPPAPLPAARLSVAAMRGETRAAVVNLANGSAAPITVTATFAGLPESPVPGYIKVHDVVWTDTRQGVLVAAALPELARTPQGFTCVIPAGMTGQLWLSVTPRGLPAGTHTGALVLNTGNPDPIHIPVELRVFDLDFPAQPTLHLGGWDETDADASYGITTANRDAVIEHLQQRYVDSPWSRPTVMPFGTFDATGQMTQQPDTTRFSIWMQRWPQARRYCVFNAVGDNLGGTRTDEPLFAVKVGHWIRFWVAFLRQRGVEPNRLVLLLLDEPRSPEQDRIIVAWARAIKAAEPGVVLWEDPIYTDPTAAAPEMLAAVDVLCPNRIHLLKAGAPFAQFYRNQKAQGRRLDLYSCSGPARLLDPYSYHRLQAWSCFDLGAESTFFWAFGDTGGADSWNEYLCRGPSYTPLFLGADSVTPGRHMEALRESVEDYEYLVMLRDRIAALEQANPAHPRLAAAKELLATAPDRVLRAAGAGEIEWRTPKDRSLADAVRSEIGGLIEQLR